MAALAWCRVGSQCSRGRAGPRHLLGTESLMKTPRLILEQDPQKIRHLPGEAVLPISCLWGGPQGWDPYPPCLPDQ